MRLLRTIAIVIAMSATAARANDNEGLFVFVGKLVSSQEPTFFCGELGDGRDDEARDCISSQVRFRAIYEILEPMYGKFDSAQIAFNSYSHAGYRPNFSNFKYALLFVHVGPKGNYVVQERPYDVYRTVDGAWATCGDWLAMSAEPKDVERLAFSDLSFPESLVFADISRFSADFVAEEFPSEFYDIRSGKAFCKKGVLAAHLVDFEEQTGLKVKGLQLDPKKKAKRAR